MSAALAFVNFALSGLNVALYAQSHHALNLGVAVLCAGSAFVLLATAARR